MKARPTIFLSGVSHEFGSFRDAVEIEIQKKGCFAENQSSFATDYRTVEEMLRRKLHDADAVIHIVGFRFGAEPNQRPADKPRRSYTQMEFDIAREMQKPLYVFLSADANVRDAPNANEAPQADEATALQLAHRQAIQSGNQLFHPFKDKTDLQQLVAAIPIVVSADFRADISRIVKYAPADLIGREAELKLLDDAWLKVRRGESQRPHIVTFVALGGEGKTSVVAKWAANLAHQKWPGCDSVFAWSFYSQGTRDQLAASSDLFLKEAITFFGDESDKEFAAGPAGAYEKGQRLARIVGQRRSLLILDGIEPLQYSPASPTAGELKDAGLAAVLKGLATDSDGLCVVTTRYSLLDLKAFWQTTAPEERLQRLSRDAGVHLLKNLGVRGTTREFETLVEDVKGHALTLILLGTYLRDAHGGDIRRRDVVKLEEAAEEQGSQAFQLMEAYERVFENEGDRGKRALAVLRLLGLFDRPMTADYLNALLEEPVIPNLTDSLIELSEAQRNIAFRRLEEAKLITIDRDESGALISLDGHPLLREYFGKQLRTQQLDSWEEAHWRLCKYLYTTTPDKPQPTLEDLQPLYQAVAHGCQAGLQKEVCDGVYVARITQGEVSYSTKKLGAYATDLGAVACFFETPWSRVSSVFSEDDQAWLLNVASFRLRALGRPNEALEPIRTAAKLSVKREDWKDAAPTAGNVSQVELTIGKVADAVRDAEQSVTYADRSNDTFERMQSRAISADALHQAGRCAEAEACFAEAEQLQAELQPNRPIFYSIRSFRYCDLLLGPTERAVWRRILKLDESPESTQGSAESPHSDALITVLSRVAYSLKIDEANKLLIDIALDYLILCRAAFYKVLLSGTHLSPDTDPAMMRTTSDIAVNSLREAGDMTRLPLGLLTRAWLQHFAGELTGPESAQANLDEACEIAERGPMRLHMADIHLYRARLFFREKEYPWNSPRADLEAAEKLINDCGYHRRDGELADAKRAILGQSG
jgi:Domain of unknown function (DUF4062)